MPDNTTVQLPPPADIDPNHSYSLVELIDIAQRCNPATRVRLAGGDQCRHRARRLSSGADGERGRRLGALRVAVPQQPRPAGLHHFQRSGVHPAAVV